MVGRYDRHGHSVVFNPLLMITTWIYFPDFFCLDLSLIRLILPRRAHDHFNLNPRQSHQSPKSFRIWSGHAARYYHMNNRPNPTFLSSPIFFKTRLGQSQSDRGRIENLQEKKFQVNWYHYLLLRSDTKSNFDK